MGTEGRDILAPISQGTPEAVTTFSDQPTVLSGFSIPGVEVGTQLGVAREGGGG